MTDILRLDSSIFFWINTGWSNPVLDFIMPLFSHLGDTAAVWLSIVFIGCKAGWEVVRNAKIDRGAEKRRVFLKIVALSCLYMSLIFGVNAGIYNSLKHLVHRFRPFVQQDVTVRTPTSLSSLPSDSSFPSGHACNAFVIATLLTLRFRRKGLIFYSFATLVAISRVYLGVHYPGDVVAGCCLGLTVSWLMLTYRPLRERFDKVWLFQGH